MLKAKLNNNKVVRYDACAEKRFVPMYRKALRYIGKGVIYSVDGVKYKGEKQMHFWKYRANSQHLRRLRTTWMY